MAHVDSSFTGLKSCLRQYVESITRRSGKLYVCPLCGSGTGTHKTGAFSIYDDGMRWKCMSCGNGGDIFDLYGLVNCVDASESARELIRLYGKPETTVKPPQHQKELPNLGADIDRFHAALPGSDGEAYLFSRGFTTDTMSRFKLGYNSAAKVVTIPYNKAGTYYGQRSILPNAEQPHRNLPGIQMPLFNEAGLYRPGICFVVESPLCAISIMQTGGNAVAISGTGGTSRFLARVSSRPPVAALALCFDADEAGKKAAASVAECLSQKGVAWADVCDSLLQGRAKDPNALLQKIGESAFAEAVFSVAAEYGKQLSCLKHEEEQEKQTRTGAGMVDCFLESIQTRRYEPIPTGISDIDRTLGGGFMRQQLVLLGAAPAAGKTALAQWIFEGMAQRGVTSVYLNLEMSRDQILARSFSRIAAKNGHKIKATEVLQGYKWTPEQRAAVIAAATEYREKIAPNMIYNPDGVSPSLDWILSYIEREAREAEQEQKPAPCVVIDYLQIIGSSDPREDSSAIIKRAMGSLKDYAIRHNTIVFVIMANNREANRSGDVTMESGRDTSALEYGADLQLGLAFTACLKDGTQKAKTREELTPEERQFVTLKVTKARFADPTAKVNLRFDGSTMTYTQISPDWQEVDVKTPFDRPKMKMI